MSAAPVAVVTGGSRGIGEATVRKFVALGHSVAILDVNRAGGEALARELGERARFYECDVSDPAVVDAVAQRTLKDLGPASILVTSAGLIPNPETVLDMDLAAHDRMWRVNYFGTVHACRSYGKQMSEQRAGAIVTLGSINSLGPLPLPAYNPGKVAIARLTQLLCAELGRHNIRVNSVGPTYVMTPDMQARVDAGLRDMNKIMEAHPLKTLPTPADIADAIVFLCSPAARTITGVLLPVDSGWATGTFYNNYAGGLPWAKA